jgi:hypothetical protein
MDSLAKEDLAKNVSVDIARKMEEIQDFFAPLDQQLEQEKAKAPNSKLCVQACPRLPARKARCSECLERWTIRRVSQGAYFANSRVIHVQVAHQFQPGPMVWVPGQSLSHILHVRRMA